MATYYFMIGVPASGKSTEAEWLRKEQGCVVVCPDTIRETERVGSEEAFSIARTQIAEALHAGHDVVFDATNTIHQWRTENIAAGKQFAERVVCIWFDVPLEVCIQRHLKRAEQGVRTTLPVSVIERMRRQLCDDPPLLEEGFDEIRRIT